MYDSYKKQKTNEAGVFALDSRLFSYIDQVLESKNIQEFKKFFKATPSETVDDMQLDFFEELFAAALQIYKTNIPLNHSEAVFNGLFVEPFVQLIAN